MTEPEIDLLAIDHGSVSAPAGCGKTHIVANALTRHSGPKPILVLTHTNAGVVALKNRLLRADVPSATYRLSTLDGWAIRLIATFPGRSGHDPGILELRQPARDYQAIRCAAVHLLNTGHVKNVIASTYDRLIVDEYQDCTTIQHAMVGIASETLRTCVLGDPLQAIFGFAGKLADWETDVRTHFPPAGGLSTPWRWINAGERAFGEWLLDARRRMLSGLGIDLRSAPPNVRWLQLDGTPADWERRLEASNTAAPTVEGGVLIIAESKDPQRQRRLASLTPGAVTVESVDLRDLVDFARSFDLRGSDALERLLAFAEQVMTDAVDVNLKHVARPRPHGSFVAQPTEVEAAALAFVTSPTHRAAVQVLTALNKQAGVRVHRPLILAACVRALMSCPDNVEGAFADASVKAREENRLLGRPLPKRAVGSTLLLKGLEAEVAVLLDPDPMDRANLYVAMTRGSKKLVICSSSPMIGSTGLR